MKVYSIGREVGCDIVINDSTDVISRRHATLNVTSSGKMTIIDQSHNGTYVNGIRIAQNVPVPVTRKDKVSFARVARLDWNMVPKTTSPLIYVAAAIVALLIVVGGIIGYSRYDNSDNGRTATTDSVAVAVKDINHVKDTLKSKISEATGLKSAITVTAVADTLNAAIKTAQETYDKDSATKEEIVAATEKLQKAIDVAKDKMKAQKPTGTSQQKEKKVDSKQPKKGDKTTTKKSPKCGTCGKPLSECKYKGKHPGGEKPSLSDKH